VSDEDGMALQKLINGIISWMQLENEWVKLVDTSKLEYNDLNKELTAAKPKVKDDAKVAKLADNMNELKGILDGIKTQTGIVANAPSAIDIRIKAYDVANTKLVDANSKLKVINTSIGNTINSSTVG
jgi:uncharacterized protein YeeX (DUF496 family)